MNYRIDNLQYCKWSREVFEINRQAGLDAVHVTVVFWGSITGLEISSQNCSFIVVKPENWMKSEALSSLG